ncbi:MAG: hypothetical protein AAF958_01255 [Planctomycetota bacterium]
MVVPRRRLLKLLSAACLGAPGIVALGGCAQWKNDAAPEDSLVSARRPPTLSERAAKSERAPVRVEIEVFNLVGDVATSEALRVLWQSVDTASLDYQGRSQLGANGIRMGVLRNAEMLANVRKATALDTDGVEGFLASADVVGELSRRGQRIPLRVGKAHEWPTRHPISGNRTVLVKHDGEVLGRTLVNPQPCLTLFAKRSTSDESVLLTIRPDIDHGDARPNYVASESAIRIDSKRERWSLDELTLRWRAVEGEVLILGRTPDNAPLADLLFQATRADGVAEETLLAIQLLPR